MIDYKIVDYTEVPMKGYRSRTSKWIELFDSLPYEKAIVFEFDTNKEAHRTGMNISGSCRQRRRCNYKIHFRTMPNNGRYQLYVWKEART